MFAGLSREQCLQCSMSTLSPALGRTCGRREREAGAGSGRSNPSRARARNGGRHPGPRGAGNLRGLTEERGSWSVQSSVAGLVPMQAVAPATTGALWKKEEGNVVSMRRGACTQRVRTLERRSARSGTRPSLGPETRARQSVLISREHGATRVHVKVSRSIRYRGRANLRKQEEPAPGSKRTDACAARRASPLCRQRQGSCVMRKKRKVVMAIVPARKREPRAQRPYVGNAVAEVGRQHPGPE